MGLLTSDQVPAGRTVFYGMIADGIHTNPAALRIAHRSHPSGLICLQVNVSVNQISLPVHYRLMIDFINSEGNCGGSEMQNMTSKAQNRTEKTHLTGTKQKKRTELKGKQFSS